MKHPAFRMLSLILILSMFLSVATACGSGEPAETTTQTPATTTASRIDYDPTATLPPVTIGVASGTSAPDTSATTTPATTGATISLVTTDPTTPATTPDGSDTETSETTPVTTPDTTEPPTESTPEATTEPTMTIFTEDASQTISGAEEVEGTVILRYSINYPTFSSNNSTSPSALNAAVAAAAAEFEAYAKDVLLPFAQQAHKAGDSMLPFTFSVDYEVAVSSAMAVSVVFTKTEHTGETREAYARSACMFSPVDNSVMTLSDVFSGGASTYTQTIYKAVFAKIAAAPDAFYADYQNLAKFFDLSDHWYLGENGVVIFFDPFQIAGYDKGIVEFVLPYDEYSSDLKINPLYMG
ncbi:MAG: DUF3298 domain-containing protein [Clostridia bacterium]|nr:DUF3298 domain-containing protein [Clostridia bacterium]